MLVNTRTTTSFAFGQLARQPVQAVGDAGAVGGGGGARLEVPDARVGQVAELERLGDLLDGERAGDVLRWAGDGKLEVEIQRVLDLRDSEEAHRMMEAGESKGKLLLRCSPDEA